MNNTEYKQPLIHVHVGTYTTTIEAIQVISERVNFGGLLVVCACAGCCPLVCRMNRVVCLPPGRGGGAGSKCARSPRYNVCCISAGIVWTLYNLARYPEHQEKCRQEVDAIFNEKGERCDGLVSNSNPIHVYSH